ncbi:MAG: carboxypeptidase-like regulatory domain-containing protein [Patescibacteria group bacterium]|nr:carboxypeptidase-like regulatory domain-containing protein [Patescibacteria group bacterium]
MIKKNKFNKSGFTMIELLVVVVIVGLLFTLSVVSLQNARVNARDAKRVADIKQIQFGLELYYRDQGEYPESIDDNIAYNDIVYLSKTPTPPTPSDGNCSEIDNNYSYYVSEPVKSSYILKFCLGGPVGDLNAGKKKATAEGIEDLTFAFSGIIKYYNLSLSPINGVDIYLGQGGDIKYTAETNSSGFFNFPKVIPGTYNVYISFSGSNVGAVNSTDAVQLSNWMSSPTFGGLRVLAGDVYDNSPSTIINSSDSDGIINFFITSGASYGGSYDPAGAFVFASEENLDISYDNFPIEYANGGPDIGFSNITIDISDSDVQENFYSLVYGDINRSFTPY